MQVFVMGLACQCPNFILEEHFRLFIFTLDWISIIGLALGLVKVAISQKALRYECSRHVG